MCTAQVDGGACGYAPTPRLHRLGSHPSVRPEVGNSQNHSWGGRRDVRDEHNARAGDEEPPDRDRLPGLSTARIRGTNRAAPERGQEHVVVAARVREEERFLGMGHLNRPVQGWSPRSAGVRSARANRLRSLARRKIAPPPNKQVLITGERVPPGSASASFARTNKASPKGKF